MSNQRALGNNFVNKIIEKVLTPAGYRSEKAKAKLLWIPVKKFSPLAGKMVTVMEAGRAKLRPITQAEDFFECIDIISIHPKRPFTIFIQATIGDDRRRQIRQKKILDAQLFNPAHQKAQVWQRDSKDKQIVHVFELTRDPDDRWGWERFYFNFKTDNLNNFKTNSAETARSVGNYVMAARLLEKEQEAV